MFKTRLTEMFGVETPICMGGMTGVGYGELVAAVANAGALGFITAHMFPSGDALLEEIEKTKALTDKPFGVNLSQMDMSFSLKLIQRLLRIYLGKHMKNVAGIWQRRCARLVKD